MNRFISNTFIGTHYLLTWLGSIQNLPHINHDFHFQNANALIFPVILGTRQISN